jgi:iron complex outermembrane receptor protein
VFVDFNWTPLQSLTVSPGFKYVNFKRTINAAEDTLTVNGASDVAPVYGSNTYSSPLYFLTVNEKLTPDWSIYGQYATSFLIPQLSDLQVPGVSLQHLVPETTVTYQGGTVFSKGRITTDADAYLIVANNTNISCTIPNPEGGYESATCNAGKVRYSGVEGEAAYALPVGMTLFVNGSINDAKQMAQLANVAAGIAGNPAQELAGVPKWTYALGGIYASGPWHFSADYKQVGDEVVAGGLGGKQIKVPAYDTINAAISYNFSRYQVKLQGFNLADHRNLINYVPSGNETTLYQANGGVYTFQSGLEIDLSLSARF